MAKISKAETLFALHCRASKLPVPLREHRFALGEFGRQWRFDFCWPAYRVAAEIEGLAVRFVKGKPIAGGRHTSVSGYTEDCLKYDHAALLQWFVLRFTQRLVKDGTAINLTTRMLRIRGWS